MDCQVDKAMEILKFPPTLRSHPKFPTGVPSTIKTWGALLRWANEDPSTDIKTLHQCIRELRKPYYQTLLISEQYTKLQQKQREEKERKRADRIAKELSEELNKENIPASRGECVGRGYERNLSPLKEIHGNTGYGKSSNLRDTTLNKPRLSRSGTSDSKASSPDIFSKDMLGFIFQCTADDPSSKSTSQWLHERGFEDLSDFTMRGVDADGDGRSASRHRVLQMINETRNEEQDVWELRQRELAMAKHAPSVTKNSGKMAMKMKKLQIGNGFEGAEEAEA